jgi:hypothetical protein
MNRGGCIEAMIRIDRSMSESAAQARCRLDERDVERSIALAEQVDGGACA